MRLPFLSTGLALVAAGNVLAQMPNTLTEAETRAGWTLLFDGRTTDGWRGYGRGDMPAGWTAVDGALTRTAAAGDIISRAQYGDFELRLEWKIAEGGNSGIFYRGVEDGDPRNHPIYHSAPEMQVLDDAGHADGKSPLTSAGSAYGLYPVPPGIAHGPGVWNEVRLVVRGDSVEHWLNGVRVVHYRLGSPDWLARVRASKFNEWPRYGRAREGHLGLQDHGDWVAYRSIKVRRL